MEKAIIYANKKESQTENLQLSDYQVENTGFEPVTF